MALGNVFNPTAGISNPFANFSKNVKPTKTQQVQSQIANPNMSVNPSATPAPNMSTVNGPAVGKIVRNTVPTTTPGSVSAPMSTLSPSMSALPMMKKTLPTIPAYDPTKIAGFNTPVIGNQFSSIPGFEKTQFTNFPEATKQTIGQEIQAQNPTQSQPSEAVTLPENTIPDLIASINTHPEATVEDIQKYFPELQGNENTFPDLLASLKAHPDATPEQIKQYFPELTAGQKQEAEDNIAKSIGDYFSGKPISTQREINDLLHPLSGKFDPSEALNLGGKAVLNIIPNAIGMIKGLADMVIHPKQTVEGIKTIGQGLQDLDGGKSNTPQAKMVQSIWEDVKGTVTNPQKLGQFLAEHPLDVLTVTSPKAVGDVIGTVAGKVGKAGKLIKGLELSPTRIATAEDIANIGSKTAPVVADVKKVSEIEDIAGRIIQGQTKDKAIAAKALSNIDTKGVKTYSDLSTKIGERESSLAKAVDNETMRDPKLYSPSDFDKKIKVGDQQLTQNFVEKGLDHLEELYKTTDDLENLAKIKDIHSRFNSEGLSLTDTNNIARLYNREFGSKAFSKMGDPLTSVNAQSYENIRSGIKDAVRSKLPDEKARILDKEYSEAANTKNLVDKMVEKVNKLEQSVQKRGIVERTARLVGRTVDTLTAGGVKGFLTSFLPSNVGNKVMNALDIQESLQSNLKRLESAIKKIDNGTISDSELKSLFIKDTDGVVSTANNSSNMFTSNEQSSKIKALPNKETVSPSNIGTDANPIVANSPKKQDIVELPQKNIFNKSEGNIFTEKKEVKKPVVKTEVKVVEQPNETPKSENLFTAKAETKVTETKKYTPEQATKYNKQQLRKIDKEFIEGSINQEEYRAKRAELRQDMKYISRGIDPKKLQSAKTQITEGVIKGAEKELGIESKKPQAIEQKNPFVTVKGESVDPLIQEARKYKSAEEFEKSFEYHGGPKEIKGGKLERYGAEGGDAGGIFTTSNEDYANIYSKNYGVNGTVHRVYIGDKKIIDLTEKSGINKFKDFIGKEYKNSDGEVVKFSKQDFDYLFPSEDGADRGAYDYHGVVDALGYDGAKILERSDFRGQKVTSTVLNEGGIKIYSKDDIKKIWEEANKSKQTKSNPFINNK